MLDINQAHDVVSWCIKSRRSILSIKPMMLEFAPGLLKEANKWIGQLDVLSAGARKWIHSGATNPNYDIIISVMGRGFIVDDWDIARTVEPVYEAFREDWGRWVATVGAGCFSRNRQNPKGTTLAQKWESCLNSRKQDALSPNSPSDPMANTFSGGSVPAMNMVLGISTISGAIIVFALIKRRLQWR